MLNPISQCKAQTKNLMPKSIIGADQILNSQFMKSRRTKFNKPIKKVWNTLCIVLKEPNLVTDKMKNPALIVKFTLKQKAKSLIISSLQTLQVESKTMLNPSPHIMILHTSTLPNASKEVPTKVGEGRGSDICSLTTVTVTTERLSPLDPFSESPQLYAT